MNIVCRIAECFYPERAPLQNASELGTLARGSDVPGVSGRRSRGLADVAGTQSAPLYNTVLPL
jgi:hypothetical protein